MSTLPEATTLIQPHLLSLGSSRSLLVGLTLASRQSIFHPAARVHIANLSQAPLPPLLTSSWTPASCRVKAQVLPESSEAL